MSDREHSPAEPRNIGLGRGLVYCKACGRLLGSENKGRTTAADKTCVPVKVGPR